MKIAEKIETTTALIVFTEDEQKALKDYKITPEEVAQKAKEYMILKVLPDDTKSYKVAREALTICVHARTGTDKRRKELNKADQERIDNRNSAAKKLVAPLAPVEEHLEEELNLEDGRKAEVKAEKARIEKERVDGIRERISAMQKVIVLLPGKTIPQLNVCLEVIVDTHITQKTFQEFTEEAASVREQVIEAITKAIEAREKLDREAAERKVEAERLTKQKAEQEAVRKAQEAEAKRLEDLRKAEEEKTKKEREAIEAEKKKIQEEKDRAEFERQAKEKAEREAREKVEREAQEKKEREEQEQLEAERKERLRPDREKLLAYAQALETLKTPPLQDGRASNILNEALFRLTIIIEYIKKEATDTL